jgi:hypothetical protein
MLSGKYIGIKAIEREDLGQMLHWRNNPQFRQFFREYRELNLKNQEYWFENIVQKDQNMIMFSIVDLKNDNLLGACGFCYINWVNRNAEFSLYIGDSNVYIDQKFAPDAGNVLIKYGFNELNLHRIYAEAFDFDKLKQGLLKSLKFQLEGRHRETQWSNGQWYDSLVFGLLKRDIIIK